jgi:FixJ family two-component response regulator
VVADLRMPGRTGLDLQDELARRGLDLPLFISGQADVTSSVRAMKGGALDFIEKPFTDTTLITAVRSAIDRHRERQAARREKETLRRGWRA